MKITDFRVHDIRFPTSASLDGSDAMNKDPDYSAAYVILKTDTKHQGHGFTFTIGRGNEICCAAIKALMPLILGLDFEDFKANSAAIWKRLTGDSQLRWIGPEKGAIHLAAGALVNALWDLWGKEAQKPVYKLVADMSTKELLSCIDFSYITDCVSKSEASVLLEAWGKGKEQREEVLLREGYPCYTTSAGWLGYSEDKIRRLTKDAKDAGFTHIKLKVGRDLEDDKRRLKAVRDILGDEGVLMIDANQVLERDEAIAWVQELSFAKPWFIEEPTSPDDIEAHRAIREALKPYGIEVATGEMMHNRVMFKQFFMREALGIAQIDACRMGGVNEALAVLLMAAKLKIKVCPHAGGVGLCELVQHLSMIDYLRFSGDKEGRVIEYVDHLHEHFLDPVVVEKAAYMPPKLPGYSAQMYEESIRQYEFKG